MKVAELQRFLEEMAALVEAAGGTKTALTDLGRTAELLEPFKAYSLTDFNDFLRRAEECVRTGQWPRPGHKSPSTPGPRRAKAKITVAEAAEQFTALKNRAADPTLEHAAVDAVIETFRPLTKRDLEEVARQIGKTLPCQAKRNKDTILAEFKLVIKELMETRMFNEYRPADMPPSHVLVS